jgi:H+/Cl- antiporter ClcA
VASTLRKILYALLAAVLVGAVAVFAYMNPEPLRLDVGFVELESVSLALFAVCVFALGWLAGLASAAFALLRSASERRRMQKDLRIAETELRTLRSLPIHDAD